MANVEGYARSNYFQVIDEEAFRAMAEMAGLNIEERDYPEEVEEVETLLGTEKRPVKRFALFADDHESGWPNYLSYEGEDGEWVEDDDFDLFGTVGRHHLKEGEVAVFEESGHEKLRYVYGYSVAVNHKGETIGIDISEIYQKVKEAGWTDRLSAAAY